MNANPLWNIIPIQVRAFLFLLAACPTVLGAIEPDPSFRPRFEMPGVISKVVAQDDGKFLAAGVFDRADQESVSGLVRLTREGQLDATFVPGISGVVTAVALQPGDGKILVAGDFPGRMRSLVRLNRDGSLDPSFVTNFWAEYRINVLVACPDGKILVGGQFGYISTETGDLYTRGVARLLPDGSPDRDFVPAAGYGSDNGQSVDAVALLPDGKIYVGGRFDSFNQFGRPNLVRLRPDGSLDRGFETYDGPNGRVLQVVPRPDGSLWIAGEFGRVNRLVRPGVALLAADGSVVPGFHPDLEASSGVSALLPLPDGGLLVAKQTFPWTSGTFHQPLVRLASSGRVLANLGTTLSSTTTVPRVNGLQAITPDTLLIYGQFETSGDASRVALAEVQFDGRLTDRFAATIWASGGVRQLAIQADGKSLVAGWFSRVNGVRRPRLARLNRDGSIDLSFQPEITGDVWTMTVQADQKVLIGGFLTGPGGQGTTGLARLNPDGGIDFTQASSSLVRVVVLDTQGRILVGTERGGMGGPFSASITRLLKDGSMDTEFAPRAGAYGSVFAIAEQAGGKLVIGGNFSGAGTGDYLARLNEDGSEDSTFRLPVALDSIVTSLAVDHEDRVLVGGWFRRWGGTDQGGLGRLLPDGSLDDHFKPALGRFSDVGRIVVTVDGKILAAGEIYPISNRPWTGIVRLNSDGTEDLDFIVAGIEGAISVGSDLEVTPDGEVMQVRYFPVEGWNEPLLVRFAAHPSGAPKLDTPTLLADGQIQFRVKMPDRIPRQLAIETSDDLSVWNRIQSLGSGDELELVITAPALKVGSRFYRMVVTQQ